MYTSAQILVRHPLRYSICTPWRTPLHPAAPRATRTHPHSCTASHRTGVTLLPERARGAHCSLTCVGSLCAPSCANLIRPPRTHARPPQLTFALLGTDTWRQRFSSRSFLLEAIDWIDAFGPYWSRRGGADHVFTLSYDFGRCLTHAPNLAPHGPPSALRAATVLSIFGQRGHPCFDEERDIVIPPWVRIDPAAVAHFHGGSGGLSAPLGQMRDLKRVLRELHPDFDGGLAADIDRIGSARGAADEDCNDAGQGDAAAGALATAGGRTRRMHSVSRPAASVEGDKEEGEREGNGHEFRGGGEWGGALAEKAEWVHRSGRSRRSLAQSPAGQDPASAAAAAAAAARGGDSSNATLAEASLQNPADARHAPSPGRSGGSGPPAAATPASWARPFPGRGRLRAHLAFFRGRTEEDTVYRLNGRRKCYEHGKFVEMNACGVVYSQGYRQYLGRQFSAAPGFELVIAGRGRKKATPDSFLMLRAHFCLCPPGLASWSPRYVRDPQRSNTTNPIESNHSGAPTRIFPYLTISSVSAGGGAPLRVPSGPHGPRPDALCGGAALGVRPGPPPAAAAPARRTCLLRTQVAHALVSPVVHSSRIARVLACVLKCQLLVGVKKGLVEPLFRSHS